MSAEPNASTQNRPPAPSASPPARAGGGAWMIVGFVVGLVVGIAVGAAVSSSRSTPAVVTHDPGSPRTTQSDVREDVRSPDDEIVVPDERNDASDDPASGDTPR